MARNFIILFLAAFLVGTFADKAAGGSKRAKPLTDGFFLTGVDGKLSGQDSNEGAGRWFFEFDSDVSDGRGRICSGTAIELLPSAALEKMVAGVKRRPGAGLRQEEAGGNYRLWGRVTKYKGKNFIFPIYFLPVSKVRQVRSSPSKESQGQGGIAGTGPAINEPNDAFAIPEEIIEKLRTHRFRPAPQLRKALELKADYILVDRIGFTVRQDEGYGLFVFDALGRNMQQLSLRLLPCEALQRAEQKQSAQPEPVRFKIAGIMTEYKGNKYLLLQRAIQVYSCENFGG